MPTKKKAVKTYLSPEEYEILGGKAGQASLSLSTFIKRVCLGWEIRSQVDQKAVLALMGSRADLGRLGGLLKKYLAEPDPSGDRREELRNLLKAIEAGQRLVAADVHQVTQALLQGKK